MNISQIPLEVHVHIAFNLDCWEDIHCYTTVFRKLRKVEMYAKYARIKYEEERDRERTYPCPVSENNLPLVVRPFGSRTKLWTEANQQHWRRNGFSWKRHMEHRKFWENVQTGYDRSILNFGDDRKIVYADPRYYKNTIELWRVRYSWIDYHSSFEDKELSELSWIHLPYGDNFMDNHYIPTIDIHYKPGRYYKYVTRQHLNYVELVAALRKDWTYDKKIKMSSWIEQRNKTKYDNLFIRMVVKEMSPNPSIKDKCEHKNTNFLGRCYPFINGLTYDRDVVTCKRGVLKKYQCNMNMPLDVNDFLRK